MCKNHMIMNYGKNCTQNLFMDDVKKVMYAFFPVLIDNYLSFAGWRDLEKCGGAGSANPEVVGMISTALNV